MIDTGAAVSYSLIRKDVWEKLAPKIYNWKLGPKI